MNDKFKSNFIYRWLKKVYLYFLYIFDFYKFDKINNRRFSLKWNDRYPQIYDKTLTTGFDRHYIYHPAWAARIVAKIKPDFHVDISSTLNFCTLVSAFMPVKFYDYRPAKIELNNLESNKADLLNLPFDNNSIYSLSCMHTIEHVGLGRYGDPLDSNGDLKAISELKRVLAPGGNLLFVVPVGQPKIMFNAHRIYSYEMILDYFSDLKLEEFSLIKENGDGGVIKNATREMVDSEYYACGCFWFKG